MTAAYTWAILVGVVLGSIVSAGIADLQLSLREQVTITKWLRYNPGWFFYPVAVLQGFLVLLSIHLFATEK